MTKQIGKLYWNPEGVCLVRLSDENKRSPWRYIYTTGEGEYQEHGVAKELWDKPEVLEEIEMLEDKIHALKNAIDLMEGN